MNSLEHPLKKEIEEVRKIILSANDRITEQIKWKAPSFRYNNEDRVTFNLQGKGFFRLVFHRGAKVKDSLEKGIASSIDPAGLLEWVADDRAIVKLKDMADVEAKREILVETVARWIELN
ncbi:DUF1801 domain-containing protein [Cohnella cholangitidis]|uniref:DUF1801 domain-containing protein n=2 Tax=Cohnella cholangitidis TaxID=2598458 RepID=A0A7G5C7P7_9BACL|nr:DUF1801 domain-containing protein [Cohnella cholangitidis]